MHYFSILLLLSLSFTNIFAASKVTLQLSWFNQFQFAGYYMAKEKGFFKEEGLDVTIKNFSFDLYAPTEVNNGKAQYGVGRETLLLDKSNNNKNIVALYSIFQASPLVLLSLKSSGIDKLKKFENKRIMTTIDDSSELSLKAMLSSEKVDFNKLEFLAHTHNIMDLVNNNTDVISAYISKTPYDLTRMGIPYNVFYPKDYGFDMYSDFLFTSKDEIKNNEQRVKKFKRASLKGWRYAFDNIDETVSIIYEKYNEQEISKDALKYEARELKKLAYYKNSKLGEINLDKLQRIYDLYNVMGLVENKIDINDFLYTKSFNTLSKEEKKYIKSLKNIKVCTLKEEPLFILDEGKSKGLIPDILATISKNTNLGIKSIHAKSKEEIDNKIENSMCNYAVSKENINRNFLYSKEFFSLPLVIATRKAVSFIENLSTLKRQKIGILENKKLKKALEKKYPDITFIEYKSLKVLLNDLVHKKIFAAIENIVTLSYYLKQKSLLDIKISGKLEEKERFYFLSKPNNIQMINILNKAIKHLSIEDKNSLLYKYNTIEYEKKFDYSLLWKFAFFFLLIILALIYRQYFLNKVNKELKEKIEDKTKQLRLLNENLEKRIEEELRKNTQKDKLLSQQLKMAAIGEMIENISHHWRQPLSIISTTSSGLLVQKEAGILKESFLKDSLESITKTSKDLSQTIEEFRNFYEKNKKLNSCNIKDIYEKTKFVLSEKLLKYEIELAENVESINFKSISSELTQVLINLFNNSIDALVSNPLIKKKLIVIDIYKKEQYLIIRFKDNAQGIKKKNLEKIFDPYFTTKKKLNGTGLGLYMCQEIIKNHLGGSISVKNETFIHKKISYMGAEFKVKLPIIGKSKKDVLIEDNKKL